MGATQSKVLEDLTTEEVSAFVSGLGKKGQYASYAELISSNAVDGEVLASIEEEEMKETMECLNITNFLHQKVLIKEWHKAKLVVQQPSSKGSSTSKQKMTPTQLQRGETSYTASDSCGDTTSEITMDANLSYSGNSSPYVRKIQDDDEEGGGQATSLPVNTTASSSISPEEEDATQVTRIPMRITVQHKQAIEPLQLPKSLDLLPPESQELEPFRQIAGQALHDFQGSFAEVNLLDTSPGREELPGVNNIAFIQPDKPPIRYHQETEMELCRKFILGMEEDFYMEELPFGEFGLKEPARYYTHIVRIGDIRVGTVCCVVQESSFGHTTEEQKLEILKFLANVAEKQFQRRQVLLERNQNLRNEIEHLKQAGIDQVLAEPYGPVPAVHASQVAARHSLFPYPTETEDDCNSIIRNNGTPTDPSRYSRRSAGLVSWHPSQQATFAERSHIPSSYYDHPAFHQGGGGMLQMMDPTPIGKRDMERVALINSLGLLQLDPLSKEAQAIQQLVEITGTLLGAELALVTLLDHQNSYLFFPTFPKGPEAVSQKMHGWLESHDLIQRHPQTGEPFVLRAERCDSLCNYTISCPHQQAFVVHDIAQDQSVSRLRETTGMGFYSGAPIVLRGLTVGGLCVMGRDPRPTFGRVQELQQEELAQMIAQQYESWALGREMKKLERERRLMMGNPSPPDAQSLAKMRSNRPEGYAALVFTSIQGVDALQGSPALKAALVLHNDIVIAKIADNSGYEVHNENGAFHVAFSDVVNAVNFCLRTQEALHSAPWGDDLLALPHGCEDASKTFRGLRVKMTIHCGDVELTTVPLSGKLAYTGETYHVAKSLEGVCHGGQILVTSDVWTVASEVVESSLDSPQVLDLGSHVLPSQSGELQDGITVSKILQLVPKTLAHDYVSSSRQSSEAATGRVFPPISTTKSVGASFHNAPVTQNKMVSMVFVDTSQVEAAASTNPNAGLLLAALAKRIGSILREGHPQGYQCHQDFLLSFEESADAIRFGLAIQGNLNKEKVLDISLENQVKIGVQEGLFDSMGPNPISGKAEYFGRVVKDVALTAHDTAPGCVYLGREPSEWDQFNLLQPASNGFMLDFMSRKYFEDDIENEFVLFKCQPCKSWYDQIVENRSGRKYQSLQQPWRNYQ